MLVIDLGDEQRDVRIHPVRLGVGHDVDADPGERLFHLSRDVGLYRGEGDPPRDGRFAARDGHRGDPLRQRRRLTPAHDVAVALARALL